MLCTHIAQLMTLTTNVYIAAKSFKPKGVYVIWTKRKLIPFLLEKFVVKFTDLLLNFQV